MDGLIAPAPVGIIAGCPPMTGGFTATPGKATAATGTPPGPTTGPPPAGPGSAAGVVTVRDIRATRRRNNCCCCNLKLKDKVSGLKK